MNARSSLCVLLVGALAAAVPLMPGLARPWPVTQDGVNAGRYTCAIERTWILAGWTECRGVPYLSCLPSRPPIPAPQAAYLTHPPLYRWTLHGWCEVFGFEEWSVRLLSVLQHALACGLIAWVAFRRWGFRWGLVAALLAAVLPASVLFGAAASYEPGILMFVMAAVVLHVVGRDRPWPLYALVLLTILVGTLWDWSGAFVVPTIALMEVARGRSRAPSLPRGRSRVVACAGAAFLSVATFIAWVCWARETDPGSVVDEMMVAQGAVAQGQAQSALIRGVGGFSATFFTIPVLALAAIGIVAEVFRITRARRRRGAGSSGERASLALSLLVPGAINVALFPRVAATHEFWIYLLLPGVVLCAVAGAAAVNGVTGRGIGMMVMVAAIGFGGYRSVSLSSSRHTTDAVDLARSIGAMSPSGALLAFPFPLAAETLYVREPYVDMVLPSQFELLVALTRSGTTPWDRVTFVAPQFFLDVNPAVADALARLGDTVRVTRPDITRYPVLKEMAGGAMVLFTSVP